MLAEPGIHSLFDLESHDLAESTPAQLVLDGLPHVVYLIGDVVVGIPRDSKQRLIENFHAWKQRLQVGGNRLFERD